MKRLIKKGLDLGWIQACSAFGAHIGTRTKSRYNRCRVGHLPSC